MARSTALAEARSATVERVRQFSEELDRFAPSIEQALPAHIPIDRFKRVLVTAVNANPDLLFADRRTLYNASVKCASDGLLPDGRDAVIVVHNTKMKLRNAAGLDEEFRIDACSYLPMIAGIRRRMQNSGEVLSAEAEVVCANDKFAYQLGDHPFIEHAPPPLTEERGEIIGAYAIIRLRSGEVIRDVMPKSRIEQARKQGRGQNSLMWDKFYDEGAKKTVLRRASKQVPQSADIDRLLNRDDEPPVIDDIAGLPAPQLQRIEPPAPPPPIVEVQQDNEPSYIVIDLEGAEVPLQTVGAAAKALTLLFAEAARQGVRNLQGARESNEGVLQEVGADDPKLFAEVIEDFNTRLAAAQDAERRANAPPPPTTPPAEIPPPAPPPPAVAAPAANAPAATSTDASPGRSSTGEEVVQKGAQPFPLDVVEPDEDIDTNEPGDLSPGDEKLAEGIVEDGTSRSWLYEPVMRNGRYDWRAWALGIFVPRINRDVKDSTDMALALADNEENLKRARVALHEGDKRTLEQAIEQKWRELG